MIETVIIIICVIVFLAVSYNKIVNGNGRVVWPREEPEASQSASNHADISSNPIQYVCKDGREIYQSHETRGDRLREECTRINTDRIINDWQSALEREIREGKK